MSMSLGSTTVQKNVNTSFTTPFTGLKSIIVTNLSGLTCRITMQGGNVSKTLNPGISDWFDVRQGYTGTILINPLVVILNPSSYAGNTITFDAIGAYDSEQNTMYPIQLTLPAVTTTASGKPIFTATAGYGNTTTNIQQLNVFNPATSNVNYTFHSARVFTTDVTKGNIANMFYKSGADLNLSSGVSAVSHLCEASPPVSTSNCTTQDSTTSLGGNIIEVFDTEAGRTIDFLSFPDIVILTPGGNLRINADSFNGTPGGAAVRLTLKWTEDQIV